MSESPADYNRRYALEMYGPNINPKDVTQDMPQALCEASDPTPKDAVDESDQNPAPRHEDEEAAKEHLITNRDDSPYSSFLTGASHGRRSRDDEVKELRSLVERSHYFMTAYEDIESVREWLQDAEKVMGKAAPKQTPDEAGEDE